MKKSKAISIFLILTLAILLCNLFICRLAFVYGESMSPTLETKDCILVWKMFYKPNPGDIVMTDRENAFSQMLVKRVIAVEDQQVWIKDGQVMVDGTVLEEPYLNVSEAVFHDEMKITVPEGEVFLMGDNRNRSKDSRDIGCIRVDSLEGKVVARIFPFNRIKFWG